MINDYWKTWTVIVNKVIDKYVPAEEKSLSPKDVFGEDWMDEAKKLGRII